MTTGKRLILLLMFGTSLGAYVFAFVYTMRGGESRTWPSVRGVVLSRTVQALGSDKTKRYGTRTSSYFPRVTYEYSVDGKGYEGHDIAVHLSDNMSKKDAHARIARYSVGSAVEVFYDPSDPASAVLETDWDRAVLMEIVGFGTFALLFALGLTVEFRREKDEGE